MLRIDKFLRPERSGWSAISVVAVLLSVWAAVSVTAALVAADRFARLRDFSVVEVLATSLPYAGSLLVLLALLAALCTRRGAWANQAQFVKLGIVIAIVAGLTAWLLVAYAAVFSDSRPGS